MPSKKNIQLIEDLKDRLNKSKSVVLADYKGLNVGQLTQLRKNLKEAGGELKVIKNTLLKIGLEGLNFPISDFQFEGPTAIIFAYENEVEPIKVLYQFFEENELPKIKIGFLAKELMAEERVIELAKLPSHEQLKAKLVAVLNSPVYGLVYSLKGNLNKLVSILKEVKSNGKK